MVGMGLKKYADELGFDSTHGVVHGVYRNYMITMCEGGGWKSAAFAVTFPDENVKASIQAMLTDAAFTRKFRTRGVAVTDAVIEIRFYDTMKTMDRLREAVELVCGMLSEAGVYGVECCNVCRGGFADIRGEEVLIGGNIFYMHPACADSVDRAIEQNAQTIRQTGSLGMGILGAAIGAILGGVVWGFVYYMGYFAAVAGFLIGFASSKGYDLLGGVQTKAKGFTVLASSFISAILSMMIALTFSLQAELLEVEGISATFGDTFVYMINLFMYAPEVRTMILGQCLLSLLFVFLGIFQTLHEIFTKARVTTSSSTRLGK